MKFERFTVIEIKTGKKICECGNELDAIMMMEIDSDNRTYTRDRFILDQIVDVSYENMEADKQLKEQKILNEGQGNPVIIN